MNTKAYTYFIGVDVSRNELDFAVIRDGFFLFHREILNEVLSISEFLRELKSLAKFTFSKSIFCMEATGFYGNHLLKELIRLKTNVVVEDSMRIKYSLGKIRGKNDKLDAIRIAQYAYNQRDNLILYINKSPAITRLRNLHALRNRLMRMAGAIQVPLDEQRAFISNDLQKELVSLCKKTIETVKLDLKQTDAAIDQTIKNDERLQRLFLIITSVPNVGRITAIQIILSTNAFRDITTPKKFACYSGVAPFKKESGLFKGKAKVSQMANKKIKTLLHICAVTAIRKNQSFSKYYERKVSEGKAKMSVINAVRYKLILRIFACLNQDRLFEAHYQKNIG